MIGRAGAGTYWHTLRHLRPIQFYGRLRNLVARPRLGGPTPRRAPVTGHWQPPIAHAPSLVGEGVFRFLNDEGDVRQVGWRGGQKSSLWRYNQHYFDDLNARASADRRAWHESLLRDWMRANPPPASPAWDAYPCSLRIVNWLKWVLAGNELPGDAWENLAMQVRRLHGRLEWHLLGNHLFANAKALVVAGLAFEGGEAAHWLRTGLRVLARQVPEQVLADGGHFELSPMYQAILTEDLLDLCNAAAAWPDRVDAQTLAGWRSAVTRMLAWQQAMTHPDGEISLFNDAAPGIAPNAGELLDYARRLKLHDEQVDALQWPQGCTFTQLADSGYLRVGFPGAMALLDVAPLGPDYLLGHAHADTLSFELSVGRNRMIVNGGTSRYGLGQERSAERATAAHSTVEVDGQDSSEVWSGFRVARRAYPVGLVVDGNGNAGRVSCSHDGYRRLPGRCMHRRTWTFGHSSLLVEDIVEGRFETAIARFILHPDTSIEPAAPGRWHVHLAQGQRVVIEALEGAAQVVEARFAMGFGHVRSTQCLAVRLQAGRSCVSLDWR